MNDCLFCKIIKKEIPSYKIYEDDKFFSFLDIYPRVKGHALVIPKDHYRWVYDVPNFSKYWEVAKKISLKIQNTLNSEFVSFVTMGEEVPHAHIHILPQQSKSIEGIRFQDTIDIEKEEIQSLADKIKGI